MNAEITKLIMKFFNRYQVNVRDSIHEKNEIVKEAQAKIDAFKIEQVKKQINQYDKIGD